MPTAGVRKRKTPASKRAGGRTVRSRLEVDERRAQLVSLGIDLFASHAYDELSVDELARVAGISKGLLYHYFPTKRDFYVATVREAARQLVERTEMPAEMPPEERLRAGLDAYLDYVEAHGPAYASLMRGGVGSDAEVTRVIEDTRTLMCDRLLRELPSDPSSGPESTPVLRVAVRGWLGFCEATSLEWVERRAVSKETIRALMQEVLIMTVPMAARLGGGK
jgi:AcrR family transcriptional regulator